MLSLSSFFKEKIMNRKEITKFLSKLLEQDRLSGVGKYWASEVTFDYGKTELTEDGYKSLTRRVDYLQFCPEHQLSISGIEHGIFICYEIKSCKADYLSGHGQNFIGEKNYLVMTVQTYNELKECGELNKLSNKIGIMVAMPYRRKYDKNKIENELKNPTDMEDIMDWYLETVKNTRNSYRDRSTSELLFCMLRSKK